MVLASIAGGLRPLLKMIDPLGLGVSYIFRTYTVKTSVYSTPLCHTVYGLAGQFSVQPSNLSVLFLCSQSEGKFKYFIVVPIIQLEYTSRFIHTTYVGGLHGPGPR